MNKHILLAMKWLKDKDSVSQYELEKNKSEAYNAWYTAAHAARTTWAAAYATACAAVDAAYHAANAGYWVDLYFDRTGEDKNEYIKELNK